MTAKKEEEKKFEIEEVPTQIAKVVKNTTTNEEVDMDSLIVQMANDISDIKKTVVG